MNCYSYPYDLISFLVIALIIIGLLAITVVKQSRRIGELEKFEAEILKAMKKTGRIK